MQNAFNIGLSMAVAALTAGLAYSIVTRPEPGPSAADIRMIVSETIAETQPEPPLAAEPSGHAAIEALIEDYLVANPRILERMSVALEDEMRAEETERSRIALNTFEDDIYNDPDNVVLGNPDGDVTLVEMFDYNCGYCRQVVADVLSLVEEDPDLRVILKEFPILSQGSVDAARIGILVNGSEDVDYQDFHMELFAARGAIDTEAALAAANKLGLSRVALELDMNAPHVTEALQRTYSIAQGLGVSGTPTFIIGNEVIPGAVSKAELVRRIANMRECGATQCSSDG